MLKTIIVAGGLAIGLAVAAPKIMPALLQFGERSASKQSAVATTDSPAAAAARVSLAADRSGHYRAEAVVNGRPLPVVIDTGATTFAVRYEDARALGLIAPGDRYDIRVSTANGVARAKRVRIGSVRVGGIVVRDVEATVSEPGALGVNLLGMSFLGRLDRFEAKGGRLVLEN